MERIKYVYQIIYLPDVYQFIYEMEGNRSRKNNVVHVSEAERRAKRKYFQK